MTEKTGSKTIRLDSIYGEIETFENDLITDQIRKFGGHTRPEFSFALSALSPIMNVFDIGAHIGTFSLAALKKLNSGAKLLAVEGNPRTFEVLSRNLSNKPHQIFPICGFVGAVEDMSYMQPLGNTGGSRFVKANREQKDSVSVTDIDRLAGEYFAPDFIKIDVEGAEYDALRESKFVSENYPILYVEVNKNALNNFGQSPKKLELLLSGFGYRYFVNSFDRNGAHDIFRIGSISHLNRSKMFDVLCVHPRSEVFRALDRVSKAPSIRDLFVNAGRYAKRKLRAI